jgi:hypothetical protein
MRTWKQGVVGKLSLSDGKEVFIKCLKYPLAVFYHKYSPINNSLEVELFYAFLDLSVLKYINKVNEIKMTSYEVKISMEFSIDYKSQLITINPEIKNIQNRLLKVIDIEREVDFMESKL